MSVKTACRGVVSLGFVGGHLGQKFSRRVELSCCCHRRHCQSKECVNECLAHFCCCWTQKRKEGKGVRGRRNVLVVVEGTFLSCLPAREREVPEPGCQVRSHGLGGVKVAVYRCLSPDCHRILPHLRQHRYTCLSSFTHLLIVWSWISNANTLTSSLYFN